MPSILTAISTRKNRGTGRTKPAIALTLDDVTISLSHAEVSGRTVVEIAGDLAERAAGHQIALPPIALHINRDGSLAIATGAAPDVWPEDEGPSG